jgi:hypothetical protein
MSCPAGLVAACISGNQLCWCRWGHTSALTGKITAGVPKHYRHTMDVRHAHNDIIWPDTATARWCSLLLRVSLTTVVHGIRTKFSMGMVPVEWLVAATQRIVAVPTALNSISLLHNCASGSVTALCPARARLRTTRGRHTWLPTGMSRAGRTTARPAPPLSCHGGFEPFTQHEQCWPGVRYWPAPRHQ